MRNQIAIPKQNKEEFRFQCSNCHHIFNETIYREDIPLVKCQRSCKQGQVKEITEAWLKKMADKRKNKQKAIPATQAEHNETAQNFISRWKSI